MLEEAADAFKSHLFEVSLDATENKTKSFEYIHICYKMSKFTIEMTLIAAKPEI